ncbi:LY9 protein, partial [Nothoprocta ornata]|nr:LY9 protein [Nothoprocta ornata]
VLDGTALRIGRLQPGDSGRYGARVKLRPALVLDQAFELAVYEPLGSPRARSRVLARTARWCNVTLQCQAEGGVNVTWSRGDGGSGGSGGGDGDGTALRLALPPAAANGTYVCTVSSPAERKAVVFDLREICHGAGERRGGIRSGRGQAARISVDCGAAGGSVSWSVSGYVGLSLVLLAGGLGAALWCWRRSGAKAAEPGKAGAGAAPVAGPAAESPSDPQYAEIVRRSPPEGKDQVRPLRPPEPGPIP